MTTQQETEALRQLDAHQPRSNPLGPFEYRVIESKQFIPYEGATPRWLIISDTRCVF